MSTVLVVGPGRAGSAVARIHARSGDQVLLLGRRPGPWQARGRRAGCRPLLALPAGTRPQTVVFAVADDQLVDASRAVALQLEAWPRRLTVHLSGLHGFVPLAPFARRGERIAAPPPAGSSAEAGRPRAGLGGA
nr:hypothetical protein [Planctomycetota bacterium]